MDDVITLITETMTTDETGFPIATETEYETFCQVDTVTRAEFFDAGFSFSCFIAADGVLVGVQIHCHFQLRNSFGFSNIF